MVFFGPHPDAAESAAEAETEIGELVLDARRDDGVDGSGEEAVRFHLADGFGEHFLADAADEFGEPGEAEGSVFLEDFEDQHGPFVGDAFDDLADERIDFGAALGDGWEEIGVGWRELGGVGCHGGDTLLRVSIER